MADLGYTVDATRADAYTLPSSISQKRVAGAVEEDPEELILLNCVVEQPEAGLSESEPITLNLRRVGDNE